MVYDGNYTIEDLEIIPLNLPPQMEGLKDPYLGGKARLKDAPLVIIEMPVLNGQYFGKRVLFLPLKPMRFNGQVAKAIDI